MTKEFRREIILTKNQQLQLFASNKNFPDVVTISKLVAWKLALSGIVGLAGNCNSFKLLQKHFWDMQGGLGSEIRSFWASDGKFLISCCRKAEESYSGIQTLEVRTSYSLL